MNSTFVDWYDTTTDPNLNIISMKCIEDWDIPDGELYLFINNHYGNKRIRQNVSNVWRKAVFYAFNYDVCTNIVRDGRAARSRYIVGRKEW
ncbi:MAG TPA: hypothetical protein ENH75_11235 [archaeon]|nr:hypothetical protein [archaeon]